MDTHLEGGGGPLFNRVLNRVLNRGRKQGRRAGEDTEKQGNGSGFAGSDGSNCRNFYLHPVA